MMACHNDHIIPCPENALSQHLALHYEFNNTFNLIKQTRLVSQPSIRESLTTVVSINSLNSIVA
jgi:hypothetical protein